MSMHVYMGYVRITKLFILTPIVCEPVYKPLLCTVCDGRPSRPFLFIHACLSL